MLSIVCALKESHQIWPKLQTLELVEGRVGGETNGKFRCDLGTTSRGKTT